MKKNIFFVAVLFSLYSYAQVTNEGKPKSWKNLSNTESISPIILPSFDQKAIEDEDKINDNRFDRPWRFGYMHSVDYGFEQGQWDTLKNGDRIWRILISSPGALSLNVIFDEFYMPEGGSVYLYNNERTDLLGAYTAIQNQESGILGTWLVEGDSLWIEYYEPANVLGQGKLHIAKATHGYRNAESFNLAKGLNDSGNCNLDVDCSIGSDWQEFKDHNKKSVGILLSGGSGFCSGSLINNTENDGTPFFLTANHCYSNPAAWAFRFGWISPDPICASTENSTNGPTNMTLSGASLRARNAASDFCLVEINTEIPSDWDRVWAGWDKSDNFPTFQVGIHHPSGDIMKVCRDDDPATKEVNAGAQTWEIVGGGNSGGWEIGVTEPGSSGSPLFDQNGRIIGQLYGGGAACAGTNDNDLFDYYGRFGVSWDAGSSSSDRLLDWLDPSETNPDILDSYPPLQSYSLDGGVSVSIPSVSCGNTQVEPSITLSNLGSGDITSASIEWNVDGGSTTTINFNGILAQFDSETFSLGSIDLSIGNHEINAIITNVNEGSDENSNNDSASSTVDILEIERYNTSQVHLELTTDDYAQETSWEFRDASGTVLYSFGPYQEDTDDNTTFNYSFDVEDNQCYYFELFDEYGDGICCQYGEGSYSLTTDDETVILNGGEFGSNEITEIGTEDDLGTTDYLTNQITMYPNPTNHILNIDVRNINNQLTYSIKSVLGQEIFSGSLIMGTNSLSVDSLVSGLYFVTVKDTNSNNTAVTKIIVE